MRLPQEVSEKYTQVRVKNLDIWIGKNRFDLEEMLGDLKGNPAN